MITVGSDANQQKGACRKIQVSGKGSREKIQLFFERQAPLKDTQCVPLKDTTFSQEIYTSKRYTLGPVKRYSFFLTQSVTPFCYHSRLYTLSGPAERYKFFTTQSAT